ncbi:RNA methyltransferase [Naviculisporaceae sp. PSN 640]
MTLALLRRPNGLSYPVARTLIHPGVLSNPIRQKSTLTAINEAIRKARKLLPPHDKRRAEGPKKKDQSMTYKERQEAREALREAKPAFKIRKGHKTITVDAAKAQPLSKQKRFYDEENSFAKKSLVHQLKTGKLRDELKALGESEGNSKDSGSWSRGSVSSRPEGRRGDRPERSEGHSQPSDSFKEFEKQFGGKSSDKSHRWMKRGATGGRGREERKSVRGSSRFPRNSEDPFERSDRPGRRSEERDAFRSREERPREPRRWEDSQRQRDRDDGPREPRQQHDHSEYRERTQRAYERRVQERAEKRGEDFDGSSSSSNPRGSQFYSHAPISIPYTTAASQFLYGHSVVLAALNHSRRKLYKLYIYGGTGRQKTEEDELIARKARKKGIEVEIVGPERAQLLNKMSEGRPHNGYILEASPIPQLPVNGLGAYTEASQDPAHLYKSGFEITLAHQSSEEAAVNGTDPFIVTAKSTRKPLVVVLDQILDPGNLGAILRTVSFLGASAVAITKRGSASLTPVALKSSAGAAESITLFSIANSVHEFLDNSRLNGDWQVYAAVPETSAKKRQPQVNTYEVEDMDPLKTKPCILVLGSEGEGLSSQIMSKADYQMSIPNLGGASHGGEVDSLNVSVAAGLLTSAFMRGNIIETGRFLQENKKAESLF